MIMCVINVDQNYINVRMIILKRHQRLKVYKEQTEELIDYYKDNGELIEVNCNGGKSEIEQNILKGLHSMSEDERGME